MTRDVVVGQTKDFVQADVMVARGMFLSINPTPATLLHQLLE